MKDEMWGCYVDKHAKMEAALEESVHRASPSARGQQIGSLSTQKFRVIFRFLHLFDCT